MSTNVASALEALKKNGIRVYSTGTLPECEVIPTSSLIFNKIMDGGVRTRRITQIFSKPGVGKSVVSYTIINNALHKYPESVAILLDIECRFDEEWAFNFIEEDVRDRFLVLREEFIENAGNSLNKIAKQLGDTHISVVVVDSIAAANTARYKDADMEKMEVGGSAMGVGKFVRAVVQFAEKNNTAIIILNQLRDDLNNYGPSIGHTPGGTALKHAIDADYYLRQLSQKDTKDLMNYGEFEQKTELGETQQLAIGVAVKCTKGKNWSQSAKTLFFRRATDENDVGYDVFSETVRLALASNIITKPSEYSTTFFYDGFPENEKGEHKIVDRKNLYAFLKDNPDVFEKLRQDVTRNAKIDVETEDFVENY